jgi:hypothetical protein
MKANVGKQEAYHVVRVLADGHELLRVPNKDEGNVVEELLGGCNLEAVAELQKHMLQSGGGEHGEVINDEDVGILQEVHRGIIAVEICNVAFDRNVEQIVACACSRRQAERCRMCGCTADDTMSHVLQALCQSLHNIHIVTVLVHLHGDRKM